MAITYLPGISQALPTSEDDFFLSQIVGGEGGKSIP